MKKSVIYLAALLLMVCGEARAQRHTDQLDRGLVAMPAASGNFVSWRRQLTKFPDAAGIATRPRSSWSVCRCALASPHTISSKATRQITLFFILCLICFSMTIFNRLQSYE